MGWQRSLDHTLRSSACPEPGPMPTQGPHWSTVLHPGFRGGGLEDSQPSAPFRGSCLAGENKHTSHIHLSLSVFFESVFPLTYFPFSLGFKTSLLSECRGSQLSQHHGSYGMHLERGKNLNGVVIRLWTGLDMAWLEFRSWLLFAFVMKHLLYELLLLLLKQLLPGNPLNGCFFSWTCANWQRSWTGALDSPGLGYLCHYSCIRLGKRHMTAHKTVVPFSAKLHWHGIFGWSGTASDHETVFFLSVLIIYILSHQINLQYGPDLSSR